MESLRFTRIPMNDPRLTTGQGGRPPVVVKEATLFPPTERRFPKVAFGDVSPDGLDIADPNVTRNWGGATARMDEVSLYRMNDVTVHSPEGIVTVGDCVVDDTLAHIPFHHAGYRNDGACIEIPKPAAFVDVPAAWHGLSGNYHNHYHWMLDIVPKLQVEPLAAHPFQGLILMPPAVTGAQKDVVRLLAGGPSPLFLLGQGHSVRAKSLLYVPRLSGFGFAPNPHIAALFGRLKHLFDAEVKPGRRLYVTRRDSNNRVLRNEDAVRLLAERHGFETVALSGLSVAEQARLFAGATHIIAPHGAGLANLVFCAPGTKVLELHMNAYINWCMRGLCGVFNLDYGCIVGTADPPLDPRHSVHSRTWIAPLDRLAAAIGDPAFLPRDPVPAAATGAAPRAVDAFAFLRSAQVHPQEAPPERKPRILWSFVGAR